jgi:alpha-D-xyloside xylohydrolase
MRALSFDFRNDEKVYQIPDEYMFGPAFLVNPVTEQLYSGTNASKGKNTREVYLPKGASWYDFWTGKQFIGGITMAAAAPLQTIPLYIKAGSIVPMGQQMEYATERKADVIELRIYSGADGQFKLYEDENDTYNYEKGSFATFTFQWNDQQKLLTISDIKGKFNGMLQKRRFNIVLVDAEHGNGIGASSKIDKAVDYIGKEMKIAFK